jgi:hypothetical protein
VPLYVPLPPFVVEALEACPRVSERYWLRKRFAATRPSMLRSCKCQRHISDTKMGRPRTDGIYGVYFGEPGGARTRDHRIKSAMLYHLSYRPGSATARKADFAE